jgi:hypothetical protein
MPATLKLPKQRGLIYTYTLGLNTPIQPQPVKIQSRIPFAAAHVVCDPFSDTDPLAASHIDWESTLAYRRHLWSLGFSVAEAMDTSQRGMGLSWDNAKELITRSIAEARSVGGGVASGAGTDHLLPGPHVTIEDVIRAYEEQCAFIEGQGGRIILMASRALAACARGPEDYERVYGKILSQVQQPVILHWLGDMFDPALKGYWGHDDVDAAMTACQHIIHSYAHKVDGIKISLLDASKEVTMRRQLPAGVKMYTGDDFNYPELIRGDAQGYSHALLGIFDAIAPAAGAALQALDAGDVTTYHALMDRTVPLSRHIFQKPTFAYKTGIVFMAYLNGHQKHFRMIAGAEGARSVIHLSDLLVLADQAGLIVDPERAAQRMKPILALAGLN